ncbi:MAG: hypothetical protein HC898_08125 [Phycisphaerales bacterium]|nr:hypothetical protein [Phycisphaerales bacterium]
MLGFQTHRTPNQRRMLGTDYRIILEHVPADQIWSRVELQGDKLRKLQPPGASSAVFGPFAAREPDFIVAGQMNADHEAFWDSVNNTYADTPAVDREERGRKYLMHQWLEVGWTHIATRQGTVRRGVQFFMRQYWDPRDSQPPVVDLIHRHHPTRPYGLASYYSIPSERKMESQLKEYQISDRLAALRSRGVPFGYHVSDASLPKLDQIHAPTGWIVFHPELLTEKSGSFLPAWHRSWMCRTCPTSRWA